MELISSYYPIVKGYKEVDNKRYETKGHILFNFLPIKNEDKFKEFFNEVVGEEDTKYTISFTDITMSIDVEELDNEWYSTLTEYRTHIQEKYEMFAEDVFKKMYGDEFNHIASFDGDDILIDISIEYAYLSEKLVTEILNELDMKFITGMSEKYLYINPLACFDYDNDIVKHIKDDCFASLFETQYVDFYNLIQDYTEFEQYIKDTAVDKQTGVEIVDDYINRHISIGYTLSKSDVEDMFIGYDKKATYKQVTIDDVNQSLTIHILKGTISKD